MRDEAFDDAQFRMLSEDLARRTREWGQLHETEPPLRSGPRVRKNALFKDISGTSIIGVDTLIPGDDGIGMQT